MTSATPKRKRPYSVLLILALALGLAAPAPARQQPQQAKAPAADLSRLREHVSHLASERLEGRRTGTRGAQEAARYIAEEFHRLWLAPGGNWAGPTRRSRVEYYEYLQEFPYVAAVELGRANALKFTEPVGGKQEMLELRVGEDWMPLGFSASAVVEAARVAFVNFGITAPELSYDDYAAADVKGRVALAFAGTPDAPGNPHGRFARWGEPRFKAAAARAAGALALVLIAREDNFKDERLSRLSYDNAGGDAGLPVVVISRQAAARALGLGAAGLVALEDEYRAGLKATTEAEKEKLPDPATIHSAPRSFSVTTDLVRRNAPAANVVGVLPGSDPKLKDETIVIGAHYDHLGTGGEGSLAGREGQIHHGADDNASGTAALLELARLLSAEREKMRRTIVFVAFGGEEEGLLGSSFYVNNTGPKHGTTVAMLNMDMVGRLRADSLHVGGVGTAAEWRRILADANRAYDVRLDPSLTGSAPSKAEAGEATTTPPRRTKNTEPPIIVTGSNGRTAVTAQPVERFNLRLSEDGFGPSDHASFYLKKVPVLFFFTGVHEDYHKPSDTADRINYEGLASVLEFVREIVRSLQSADARPSFVSVAAPAGDARRTGFGVYLGTIPAYGDSGDGLKLEGVREGSPAAAAGLRAGDRIVKLAGRDVRNIQDYTLALSGMQAGREYEVELMRGSERLTLKLTPAARK